MPFSSLYLLNDDSFYIQLSLVAALGLHHYSATSRGFLSGQLFLANPESLQTLRRRMTGHSTADTFGYAMCLKDTLHGSCDVSCVCLFQQDNFAQLE